MTTEQEIRRVLKKVANEYRNSESSVIFECWLDLFMPIEEEKEEIFPTSTLVVVKETKKNKEEKEDLKAQVTDLLISKLDLGYNSQSEVVACSEEILKLINK